MKFGIGMNEVILIIMNMINLWIWRGFRFWVCGYDLIGGRCWNLDLVRRKRGTEEVRFLIFDLMLLFSDHIRFLGVHTYIHTYIHNFSEVFSP
jgi:hypothetical protein